MSQYTKYYLYKKQQRISGSSDAWVDCVPTIYSYNADGTMTPVIEEEQSADCGYTPPIEPIYKWENMNINTYYICDECPFNDKWLATYTAGTTSSAECGSSSAITNGEIPKNGLQTVKIGDCVNTINDGVFGTCTNLKSCSIGSGLTSIGSWAFSGCTGITSITIPNSVTSIGAQAFRNCASLPSINIPSGVTSINDGTFHNCYKLPNINIPNGVPSLGVSSFQACSGLTSIDIPSSVTIIKDACFRFANKLTSIDIPSGVTSIGEKAFQHCSGLTSITVEAITPPTLGSLVFDNTNNCPIYVPSGCVNTYKSAWSTYTSRIQAKPNS